MAPVRSEIGAVAQRFFETEGGEEAAGDIEAEGALLIELRAIATRLHKLEASVERMQRR